MRGADETQGGAALVDGRRLRPPARLGGGGRVKPWPVVYLEGGAYFSGDDDDDDNNNNNNNRLMTN